MAVSCQLSVVRKIDHKLEVCGTEVSGQKESRSGDRSYRRAVSGWRSAVSGQKSRDREIAPTEDRKSYKESRDREIAPTEERLAVGGQWSEESRSGDRSYRRAVGGWRSVVRRSRDREIAPTEDRKRSGIGVASYKESRDREIAPTKKVIKNPIFHHASTPCCAKLAIYVVFLSSLGFKSQYLCAFYKF